MKNGNYTDDSISENKTNNEVPIDCEDMMLFDVQLLLVRSFIDNNIK